MNLAPFFQTPLLIRFEPDNPESRNRFELIVVASDDDVAGRSVICVGGELEEDSFRSVLGRKDFAFLKYLSVLLRIKDLAAIGIILYFRFEMMVTC